MKFGVLVFPGSNRDHDAWHTINANLAAGVRAEYVWHDTTNLAGFDALVLPGGFSYGDYLRCGAIARFSPVMTAVKKFAADGGPVFGICNGFQILVNPAFCLAPSSATAAFASSVSGSRSKRPLPSRHSPRIFKKARSSTCP